MKQKLYRFVGLAFAVGLFAACPTVDGVSEGEFEAYKLEMQGHRDASQAWAEAVTVWIDWANSCFEGVNPCDADPTDPPTVPPPNGNW